MLTGRGHSLESGSFGKESSYWPAISRKMVSIMVSIMMCPSSTMGACAIMQSRMLSGVMCKHVGDLGGLL